jgi:hypothetical protein
VWGPCPRAVRPGPRVLPGSKSIARAQKDSPGTCETWRIHDQDPGWRHRVTNSGPGPSVRGGRERTSEPGVVLPREGNGVRREVRPGVVSPNSTGEAGELEPRGPRGGKGEGRKWTVRDPLEGNMTGSRKPEGVFTRQQRIAELAKQSLDTLQHGPLRGGGGISGILLGCVALWLPPGIARSAVARGPRLRRWAFGFLSASGVSSFQRPRTVRRLAG